MESIDLSNFDTSQVTDMYRMFSNCNALKSIDLSKFNTFKVTVMDYMFYNCSSLKSIDISNFDMLNCYSYDNMFSNINALNYINLYNLKNYKNISIFFNKIDNILFVCQKNKIIDNQKAYNCCNSNLKAYDCISSNNENANSTDNYNPTDDNIIPTDNNPTNENIIPTDNNPTNENIIPTNNNSTNDHIIPTDNNNPTNEYIIPTNNNNPTDDNIIPTDNNSTIVAKNKSSSKISTGIIVGIILGGVAIVGGIIAIIICRCCGPPIPEIINQNTSAENIKNNTSKIKENPMIFIFTLDGVDTGVLIDHNQTIDELIRLYFNKIDSSNLYGDPSILFLIGGRNISPPYPKEPIETLVDPIVKAETIKILVNDSEDKIKN